MSPELLARIVSSLVQLAFCLMFILFATGVIPLKGKTPERQAVIDKYKWVAWIGAVGAAALAVVNFTR